MSTLSTYPHITVIRIYLIIVICNVIFGILVCIDEHVNGEWESSGITLVLKDNTEF